MTGNVLESAAAVVLLLLLAPPLLPQQAPPRVIYIYRDSLKRGVDSTYRVIEDDQWRIVRCLSAPKSPLRQVAFRSTRTRTG